MPGIESDSGVGACPSRKRKLKTLSSLLFSSLLLLLFRTLLQISGATTGALLLVALSKDLKVRQNDQRVCFEGSGLSAGQVFGWEALLTFLLLLVIYAVAVNRPAPKNSAPPTTPSTVTAPLAIGLVVTSIALVAGGLTGGFFNPARYLAPIIAHGCNGRRWAVYIGAQMLGAIAAAICNGMLWRKHAQAGYGDMEMGAPVMVERLLVS